jgi:thiopurine S-methyltransferase
MIQEFWSSRWAEGQTGFNQPEVNDHLKRYWSRLGLPSSSRVLVPLCGKSCDLLWLRAQGHAVVGVEFVPQAIEDFFSENHIPCEPTAMGWAAADGGPPLTLIEGDFMALEERHVGTFDAFYDRASIVALPQDLQADFAQTLARLVAPGARGLLLSFEYPADQRQGPPFNTDQQSLSRLLGTNFEIDGLLRHELRAEEVARFDVDWCTEAVYLLCRG